jgi:hypothetical protein
MIQLLAKLPAWQQKLIAGIILLLCAYMLYSGIIEPQWLRLTRRAAQLSAERKLVMAREKAEVERKKLQAVLDSLQLQLKVIQDRCVAPERPLMFFAELGTVATATGCHLEAVELYPEGSASVPPPIQIVNGYYGSLCNGVTNPDNRVVDDGAGYPHSPNDPGHKQRRWDF